ncbi:hypothetical protein SAMN04488515_2015 [Cognatiyoonia koreensis]|uniref:Uncharacterized protein n=1 Tax=Cognatiyoonia koreensis TaxID=364200 RepID=A0A1I0QMA2_9RHOB|nr:hypothetical protein [Cognatiyoonia koreensis]SEW28330.1 hypothetical protein SAMN04488515_2015 [Cognatiyoonia koreensis]
MGHNWIIDVLADLKSFAHTNGLDLLADHLEQTAAVATAEIATTSEGTMRAQYNGKEQTGQLSSRLG